MKILHTLTSPFVKRAVNGPVGLTIRNLLAVMCGVFATTAAFGQTTYIWSATNGGTDIGIATNWNPNGQPSGASEDTAEWNGTVPGNLNLIYATGWPSTGFGTSGVNLYVNTNQTGSVSIVAPSSGSPSAGINGITVDSGAGSLILGDATTHLLNFATRPGNIGQVHPFINNSTNPAYMNSSIAWVAGGGDACVMDFSGSGNWIINHNLRDNNSGAGPITVIWEGPGTMFWSNGGTFLSSDPLGPIIVTNGEIILEGAGLCPTFASGVAAFNNSITNFGEVDYDANVPDTISRFITGTGTIEVSQSSLTLSGQSTYTGNTMLAGTGTLIVAGAETPGTSGPLGESNSIVFSGGTLQFSVNNTFDYSSRFSTGSGQHFNINTGGQSVTFATGLSNSDATLSMTGPGALTLAGTNAYGGATVVNSGTLIFQGPKSGTGNITVDDSATLGVAATTSQLTPATLTLGASSGTDLELFNVNSTTTPLIAAGAISSSGTQTININSGSFIVGQSYPLLTWTTGSAPAVTLGALNGYVGSLSTNNNTIILSISGTGYTWTGAHNGDWDTTTPGNWLQNSASAVFANGAPALFNDSVTGTTAVVLNSVVDPSTITVNNTASNYSITSSAGNDIAGTTGLTKEGTNILTMSGGANTYTGVTAILQGTLSVSNLANGGSASDIGAATTAAANLVLNGGGLQYVGAQVSINRSFTLGTGGGTIDSSGTGGLTLTGSIAYSGTGQRGLTLTGADTDTNVLASSLGDNGGSTSLTKNGVGTWYITATNAYSGGTSIEGGTLQVGIGGSSGSLGTGNIQDDASLVFALSSTATFPTISGAGSVTQNGPGELILPGNNTYAAGTTINGGTLEVGTGGATGSVDALANITDNGALIFNSTGSSTISGIISGTGTLEKKGSGLLKFIGANTYTGSTIIDSNATLQMTQGNTGTCNSTNIIDNGTMLLERQDNGIFTITGDVSGSGDVVVNVSNGNAGDSTLDGSNTYTGGTYILGGGLVLGDDATPGAGSIVGNVYMTNNVAQATFGPYVPATITFDRVDNFTFPGNIVGQGSLTQEGSGTLTVTTLFTYTNGTMITAGTLQIGNGTQSGTIVGAITNNSFLVLDFPGAESFTNYITGGGSVVQIGSDTLTLSNPTNDYFGATIVSNGTLIVTNVGGDMDVSGGTLATGTPGTVTTFTAAGAINISAGTVDIALNTSLPQSNTLYAASGIINYTGGTLQLVNSGPALVPGEKFTIFNQPITNTTVTILSPGFTVTNNLNVDGSVSIATVAAPGTEKITATTSGGQIHLSWPAAFTGLNLQVQTNAPGKGLSDNWVTIPGSDSLNSYSALISTNYGSVFYRLAP